MTITTVINAQSFGTSTNIGPFFAAAKTTLAAATSSVFIAAAATVPDAAVNRSTVLRVWHAVSPNSYGTALAGAHALAQTASYIDVTLDPCSKPTLVLERVSSTLPAAGSSTYHYVWLEAPTLVAAATVTVKLCESP